MEKVIFTPIGVVINAFDEPTDPKTMRNSISTLALDPKYAGALKGLEKFSHLQVIYYFDRFPWYVENVHPMGDPSIPMRGVLATRSPCRPNPIALTLVKMISVKGSDVEVTGLDALNGTPILDLKPYEDHFDAPVGLERERDPSYKPWDGGSKM
jgi:tRNA (adenine37-N6)-methyltransferase